MSGSLLPTRRNFFISLFVLWVVTFCVYSNSFTIDFQFDDTHTVQSNIFVRSLAYIPRYFVDAKTFSYRPENSGYRPMTTTALALGFALSGLKTWGYHLIKLIEHCLVATLVLLIGLRLLPQTGATTNRGFILNGISYRYAVAWFGALLFAVHRANTETVDYISAVSTLQAGLFFMLAFYLYLRSKERSSKQLFYFSVFCYFLSMLSKEEGVTLPAVIFIYEWIYGREPNEGYFPRLKSNFTTWLKLIAPYAAAAILFIVLRTVIQSSEADLSRGNTPRFIYFITQLRSWLYYWKLFFFPIELNADNLAFDFSPGLEDLRVWGALAVHLIIGWLALRVGRKFKFALFAVAWMYITVLPASSVFPLVEAVTEHRMYIPYCVLSLLAAWGVTEICVRKKTWLPPVILSVWALLLGAGAFARNEVWQTPISLWSDVLSKNPNSPRAMNILGVALVNRNEFDKAKSILERCHQIANTYLPCMVHLSLVYAHEKQFDRGLEILKKGFALDPGYVHINFHLGLYYKEHFGDFENARKHFNIVIERTQGRLFQAIIKMAEMDMEEGQTEAVMRALNHLLQADSGNAESWEIIARGYMLMGDYNRALDLFHKLLQIAPTQLRYILNLANAFERKGDHQQALYFFQRATQVSPHSVQAWQGIARAGTHLKFSDVARGAELKIAELKQSGMYEFQTSLQLVGERPRQVGP